MLHKVMKLNLHKIASLQNIYHTCCYSVIVPIKHDLLTFFQQNLGLPENEIKRIFKKYPSFYTDNYSTLSDNLNLLINFGVSKEDIIKKIQILTLHPITINNYMLLLEEGGFFKNKICCNTLLRFKYISKKSVTLLKDESYISKNIDVQHNILSFVEFPKDLYPSYCDESLSWDQIQKNVFNLYIGWRLQMDCQNIKYAQKVYHRLYNKSFRLVEKSIYLLLNECNFSKEKIRRNPYLIHSDPNNIIAILSNFKQLCGMDTRTTLNKHPKLILTQWRTIEQIKQHFEDFGIPESALAKAPEIYTLGGNTVYERLKSLKETPELASFINNPQVARLIYYYKKANLRLKYLQSKNCVSLNLLVTNNSSFERFNCNGNDKGKTNDIMIYLTKMLDKDKITLRKTLGRHPYWQYVSLLTIRKSYEFLKKKNFTKEQICHCIHILLYPVQKIDAALVTTQKMIDSYQQNSTLSIKSDYKLSFVLYNLEKDFHFSGNGIWNSQEETITSSVPNSSKILIMDTEELDHDPCIKLL